MRSIIALLATSLSAGSALAATDDPNDITQAIRPYALSEEREPCSNFDPLRRPHFGDTHVHTAWSFDASTQDTGNKPADAYRFAMGDAMGIQPYDENDRATRTIQLDRPLDFTAVTDHSEFLVRKVSSLRPLRPEKASEGTRRILQYSRSSRRRLGR